ncbi:hypothetical protein [Marinobacter shengliensis]|uniref:hypothetical protein n=1 Tax=Marinobacter shengliensis TaxID=1389223 RepID=UPI0035B750D1
MRVAMEYDHATYHDNWEDKTQRERDVWLEDFEKTTARFLALMEDGPVPSEQWGFPIKDYVLMNVAARLGVNLPDHENVEAFFQKMLELEATVEKEKWSLRDCIEHYRQQVRLDNDPAQLLKKPRDEKRARALFLITMREASRLTVSDIALVGWIIFEDEAIDERLVRRLTNSR